MLRKPTTTVLLLACAGPALAHPGHALVPAGAGFGAGLLHPLGGADHWLAMLLVGIWAAQLGGAARWRLPLAFVAAMTLGAAAAVAGWVSPAIESGIVASLLILGVLVAATVRARASLAVPLVGLLALFHGAAHGAELPGFASPLAYLLGFVVTTAALHASGLLAGRALGARHPRLLRLAGAGGVACGLALAMG